MFDQLPPVKPIRLPNSWLVRIVGYNSTYSRALDKKVTEKPIDIPILVA
jgi:hypothetical protein